MGDGLTKQQAQAYLERMGYSAKVLINRETLDDLVFTHQCSVPFETLDLRAREEAPDVALETLYNKVVTQARGGYCFELNALFEALLRALGFEVRPCFCRAVRGRPGRMPINHRGVLVALEDETLFVDVGFGGPLPAGAVVLQNDTEQHIRGERFFARNLDDGWWAIERITQGKADIFGDEGEIRRQVELELLTAPVESIDFDALNLACSRPGTKFRDHLLANLRTPNGSKSLMDDVLTLRENGVRTDLTLSTPEALQEALSTHFGL